MIHPIPAEQWPEGAFMHVWDDDGDGQWFIRDRDNFWRCQESDVPMPDYWDWRKPLFNPNEKVN